MKFTDPPTWHPPIEVAPSPTFEKIRAEMHRLPAPGTPADQLTERDKVAIASAAGVPCELVVEGHQAVFRTTEPVTIVDRGDGGYIVYSGPLR